MKVRNFAKVEKRGAFLKEKAVGVSLRVAISEEDGAHKLTMRILEIDPDGYTPMHAHEYEHAMLVLKGNGLVTDGAKDCLLEKDDVLFIPAGQIHQLKNTNDSELVLVSIIPITPE
jgi:quercetin dioxygenase-like cupin family protein